MYNMLSWLGRRTRLSGTTRLRLSTPTGDLKVEKVRIFLKSPVVYCIVSIVWKKSWRMDNSKYKISHPPPRHSFGPEFWNVAPPPLYWLSVYWPSPLYARLSDMTLSSIYWQCVFEWNKATFFTNWIESIELFVPKDLPCTWQFESLLAHSGY